MDHELFKRYESVSLSPDLRALFTDIVMSEEATRKVLLTIGKQTLNTENIGVTIKQLTELILIDRKVQRNGKFILEHTNIDRKHVEREVDKLLSMSLCFYRAVPPSKIINLTIRGKEVIATIMQRLEKAKGDEKNVHA
jgi:DNA-binding MarR family transcriptional regulator